MKLIVTNEETVAVLRYCHRRNVGQLLRPVPIIYPTQGDNHK